MFLCPGGILIYISYNKKKTDANGVVTSQTIELKPDGANILITEENKKEYAKLLCYYEMTKYIQPQIAAFKSGFNEIIPQEAIQIFSPRELELLISGLPVIDGKEYRSHGVAS